ncbi:MAG: nucleoside triphosphate pyrophosphohydrolase family protein [Cellulosilyticaceae bacterium]
MEFQEYQNSTTKTFKPHFELTAKESEILDWSLGLPGEVGEVTELVKHSIFHKEEIDKMTLAKELGDILWYIAALSKSYDIPMDAFAQLNLAKLQHRHGGSYNSAGSAERHEKEAKFEETETYQILKSIIMQNV